MSIIQSELFHSDPFSLPCIPHGARYRISYSRDPESSEFQWNEFFGIPTLALKRMIRLRKEGWIAYGPTGRDGKVWQPEVL